MSLENFKFVVNAEEYGFDPSETPRTDKMVICFLDLQEMTVFVILVGCYDLELVGNIRGMILLTSMMCMSICFVTILRWDQFDSSFVHRANSLPILKVLFVLILGALFLKPHVSFQMCPAKHSSRPQGSRI